MNRTTIARRWAKALFDLAVEEGRFEQAGQELARVAEALESVPEALPLLRDPVIGREAKQRLAEALVESLGLSETVANGLRLMVLRGRLQEAPLVARVYRGFADERAGRLRARVVSAGPIDEEAARRVAEELGRATRRQVVVDRATDPSLLGGVVAQVGSTVYDGSLRTALEALRRQLKS